MIDDFCVNIEEEWKITGHLLIKKLKGIAEEKRVSQVLVICGKHDY